MSLGRPRPVTSTGAPLSLTASAAASIPTLVGATMIWIVGQPIAEVMRAATALLADLNTGNRVVLGAVRGV